MAGPVLDSPPQPEQSNTGDAPSTTGSADSTLSAIVADAISKRSGRRGEGQRGKSAVASASASTSSVEAVCPSCAAGQHCRVVDGRTRHIRLGNSTQSCEKSLLVVLKLVRAGHRPPVRIWTALITGLTAERRPKAADELLTKMEECGVKPDSKAFSAVINAWCIAGDIDMALRCYWRMLDAGVKANEGTYPPLLTVMAEQGQLRRAERLLVQIEEEDGFPMQELYYNAIVRGLVAGGNLSEAEGVIQRMHNDALNLELVAQRKGTVKPSAATYGMVMNAYCSQGEVAQAQRLLSEMRWKRVAPSLQVFNMMIKGFSKAGNPGAAEAVLREIEGSGSWDMDRLGISPDVVCFTSVIEAWASVGNSVKARTYFKRMTNYHKIAPDSFTFASLIKAHARAGEPLKAEGVLGEMSAAGLTAGVPHWTAVVAAWCSARMPDEAMRVKALMVAAGVGPVEQAYHHIIWGFGQVSRPDGCLKALAAMVADGAAPSAVTWTTFCKAQMENGLTYDAASAAWLRTVGTSPRGQQVAGAPQRSTFVAVRRKGPADEPTDDTDEGSAPTWMPKKRWLGTGAEFLSKGAQGAKGGDGAPRSRGWLGGAGASASLAAPIRPPSSARAAGRRVVVGAAAKRAVNSRQWGPKQRTLVCGAFLSVPHGPGGSVAAVLPGRLALSQRCTGAFALL